MKFLHTADWQIGMKADHVGPAAEKVREQRLEAVRRLIAAAQEHGAEFILVAGDVFEDNGVDRLMIQKTSDILAGFGRPIYIIPGNHDPFVPGSVWGHFAWGSSPSIHVLSEERPLEMPGGILFSCPIRDKYAAKDPTSWIPLEPKDIIRVGIAHGNVQGLPKADPDHPIPRNAAERSRLDYLALGHWHSTATYPDSAGSVHMAYCGTPETSSFGERDSGNALLIEIDSPSGPPRIQSVRTGRLRWETLTREIRAEGDLGGVRSEIESLKDAENLLIAVELTGLIHTTDIHNLRDIEELLRSRCLYSRLDSARLRPAPEDAGWIENLPAGHIREAAERLQQTALSETPGAAIAARALLDLYVTAKDVTQ